jgi:hypothetical protein
VASGSAPLPAPGKVSAAGAASSVSSIPPADFERLAGPCPFPSGCSSVPDSVATWDERRNCATHLLALALLLRHGHAIGKDVERKVGAGMSVRGEELTAWLAGG